MRVCIFGAGAVGGHIAGRLASADDSGTELSILARGQQLEAIRNEGLRVQTRDRLLVSHPTASDDPDDLGTQDVVFVAVKAPSLPSVAKPVSELLHDGSSVIFVMNGIPWWYFHAHGGRLDDIRLDRLDPSGDLWNLIGPERVVGAVAYTACSVVAPGVIKAENPTNRLILGRPDGETSPLLEQLTAVFRPTGLEVSVTPRIRDEVWAKLLMNLVGGSLAVLTSSPMGEVLNRPGVFAIAEKMAGEGQAVAAALGCDAGHPREGLEKLSKSTHLQSIAQDLEAGRPMEIDAMFQVPLELARKAGIETPTLGPVIELATQRARAAGLY